MSAAIGLPALEQRLALELQSLDLPAKAWMPTVDTTSHRHHVLIVGGGMAGATLYTALNFLGVPATIIDESPADLEGPWGTTARMDTLRSPKQLTGPALGIPSLTFRAWFVAQFGEEKWEALDKIPRLQWLEYLNWYKRVMQVPVKNETRLTHVDASDPEWLRLTLRNPYGELESHYARRVVLATGRDGLGGPSLPEAVAGLPRSCWAHSADTNDYAELAGKRVGVIGAGASAMDSAATALEAGAASVDLLIRRAEMPRVNKGKGAGSPGMVYGFSSLPDEWRWKIRHYINTQQVPPPRGSVLRVSQHPQARFYLNCPFTALQYKDNAIYVSTPQGEFVFDFLIFATGFKVDWHARPEFQAIATGIRTWGDRYQASADEHDAELASLPDLGDDFAFQAKDADQWPGLSRIHCFAYPAVLSHGTITGDIPAISDGARRLAQSLVSAFFVEDIPYHFAQLQAFNEPEVYGDEWVDASRTKGDA